MNFALSDDQRLLQEAAGRYIAEQYDGEARLRSGAFAQGPDVAHWRRFAELGWLGVALPEDVGGSGGGALEIMILMEAFGRGLVVEPFLASVVLGGGILRRIAAPALAEDLLPRLASGTLQLAVALAEPRSRFDLAAVATTATVERDGWRLDGAKTLVLNAPDADHLIVSARRTGASRDRDSISLFLVPRDAPGLLVRPCRTHDGMVAGDVRLDGVSIGRDARLGADGAALPVIERIVDEAAAAVAAEAVGAMEVLVTVTADYLKLRHQFGRPLASFQVLQHRLVEMHVELEEARSLMLAATLALERGDAERRRAVSAAKVKIGQAGRLIGEEAVQMHGGIGMTDEYKIGHYYKRLLSRATLFGDVDYHIGRYAEAMSA